MKFKLCYSSFLKEVFHALFIFIITAPFVAAAVFLLYLLFVFVLGLTVGKGFPLPEQTVYDISHIFLAVEIIVAVVAQFKMSRCYVKVNPNGVFLHNANYVHFGLSRSMRLNTRIPFGRIVSCRAAVPLDCPEDYDYMNHKRLFKDNRYKDYIRKAGVVHTEEPAISGGRYDDRCALLELDTKRIIVIPIDECDMFTESVNRYLEQYKKLEQAQNNKN